MTDDPGKAFRDQIEANPSDWGLRAVFADWLEERGDDRGQWMRWQAEKKVAAYCGSTGARHQFFDYQVPDYEEDYSRVPDLVLLNLPGGYEPWGSVYRASRRYDSHHEADDDLARALKSLADRGEDVWGWDGNRPGDPRYAGCPSKDELDELAGRVRLALQAAGFRWDWQYAREMTFTDERTGRTFRVSVTGG